MSQKNIQTPPLLQEMMNRSKNLESLDTIKKFASRITVSGEDVIALAHAMAWIDGVIEGEKTRIAEIQAQLPKTEVQVEGAVKNPPDPAPEAQPAPAVGQVEMTKGQEVLQPA